MHVPNIKFIALFLYNFQFYNNIKCDSMDVTNLVLKMLYLLFFELHYFSKNNTLGIKMIRDVVFFKKNIKE